MKKLTLQEALAGARETRALEIGSGILEKTPQIFQQQFPNRTAVIVADANTFAIAGQTVAAAFQRKGIKCEPSFIFDDPNVYAEWKYVEQLEASLRAHNAIPVAIGSGVINDLAKLAAHRTDRPYLCVATAASMDGYTAFGASITFQGSKQTFNCPAPTAVIADIEIIRRAPVLMTAAGYADLMAKVTAGADWILADALGAEPIHEQAWQIVQPPLRDSLRDPGGARNGDPAAIGQLIEGLMLGGFGMQSAKSSRPASGAEHQFSHLWDMQHHTHDGAAPSHGFKVGIGTLAVTALYEQLLKYPVEQLDINKCCANWPDEPSQVQTVKTLFANDDFTEKAVEETLAKNISANALRDQLKTLVQRWPELKKQLRGQLLPFPEIKSALQSVGAPATPEAIGISRERLRDSYRLAYHIRRRFTILDVAMRCGLLEVALDDIFGKTGTWPIRKSRADSSPEPANAGTPFAPETK